MRPLNIILVLFLFAVLGVSTVSAETEQEIIDRYLNKTVAKHTQRLGWASINFTMDRINRHNDYNDFTIYENAKLSNGEFSWIREGMAIGADFGMMVRGKFAWSVGGEYWLKLGETLPEGDSYLQLSTGTSVPANPKSELQVYAATTSFHYYLLNAPQPAAARKGVSARIGASVGYYVADWSLWPEYENLNLSTSVPDGMNSNYRGSAPGVSLGLGLDYPVEFWNLGLSMDMSYLHLNFTNVAWYNGQDEEIIASLDGTPDKRIDLSLSGVRAKVELKRYFSW